MLHRVVDFFPPHSVSISGKKFDVRFFFFSLHRLLSTKRMDSVLVDCQIHFRIIQCFQLHSAIRVYPDIVFKRARLSRKLNRKIQNQLYGCHFSISTALWFFGFQSSHAVCFVLAERTDEKKTLCCSIGRAITREQKKKQQILRKVSKRKTSKSFYLTHSPNENNHLDINKFERQKWNAKMNKKMKMHPVFSVCSRTKEALHRKLSKKKQKTNEKNARTLCVHIRLSGEWRIARNIAYRRMSVDANKCLKLNANARKLIE